MDNLKSCPFCNGKAEITHDNKNVGHNDYLSLYTVKCCVCNAMGHSSFSEKHAIKSWNNRGDSFEEEKYECVDMRNVNNCQLVSDITENEMINHMKKEITNMLMKG